MKKILSFVAAALMVVNMAACSSDTSKEKAAAGTTAGSSSGTAAKPSLSIYYMTYDTFVYNAINTFKDKFRNVEIEPKVYSMDTGEDFNKALSTEILTGGGPDVVICRPLSDLDSISKVFSNGAFADINDFISKDKDFKLADYNKAVIDAGVFNGRREFLPIYFRSLFFCTVESVLKENDVSIGDNCSVKEFSSVVDKFIKNGTRKSKYMFDSNFDFYSLMNFYGNEFFDYENKKCNFDSDEFRDLLEFYKKIQSVTATEEIESKYGTSPTSLLKNRFAVLTTERFGSLKSVFSDNVFANYDFNEELKIVNVTASGKESELHPVIYVVAAINNNCKNKEYAYEFIKTLLADETQRAFYNNKQINTSCKPVNNKTFLNDYAKFTGPVESFDFGTMSDKTSDSEFVELENIPLSDALAKRIENINNNMSKPVFVDKSVKTIIDDAVKDFISGKSSADKASKLINDKVELFLNE